MASIIGVGNDAKGEVSLLRTLNAICFEDGFDGHTFRLRLVIFTLGLEILDLVRMHPIYNYKNL